MSGIHPVAGPTGTIVGRGVARRACARTFGRIFVPVLASHAVIQSPGPGDALVVDALGSDRRLLQEVYRPNDRFRRAFAKSRQRQELREKARGLPLAFSLSD